VSVRRACKVVGQHRSTQRLWRVDLEREVQPAFVDAEDGDVTEPNEELAHGDKVAPRLLTRLDSTPRAEQDPRAISRNRDHHHPRFRSSGTPASV
jgi:hypothetical protein